MTRESPASELKIGKKEKVVGWSKTFKTSFVRWNIIIFQSTLELTCQAHTVLRKGSILAPIMACSELANPAIIWNKNNWPDPATAWLGICFVSLLTVLIVTSCKKRLKSIMPMSLGRAFPSGHQGRKEVFRCRFPQKGTETQPGKPKAGLKRDNLVLLENC